MKLLVISQYFTPDITAAAFRISETVDGLNKNGIDVFVITSTPHKSNADSNFKNDEKNIIRIKVPFFRKQTKITYLYQYVSFTLKSIIKSLNLRKHFKYDIILVSSPPITIAFVAFIIKFITKKPLIFDIRDIWPDSAVAIKKLSQRGLVYNFFKKVEKYIYTKSDYLTCVAEPMRDYIRNLSQKDNIKVIYNGASDELLNLNTNKSKFDYEKDFFYTYAGNIGHAQDIITVIKAFSKFLSENKNKNCYLNLIGNGPEKENAMNFSRNLFCNERIIFKEEVQKKELRKELLFSHVLIIPLIKSDIFKLTIPSKVFDYMTFQIPIISTISGEGRQILSKSKSNINTKLTVDDLAESFSDMYVNYGKYNTCSTENKLIVKNYTRTNSNIEFIKILNEINK